MAKDLAFRKQLGLRKSEMLIFLRARFELLPVRVFLKHKVLILGFKIENLRSEKLGLLLLG